MRWGCGRREGGCPHADTVKSGPRASGRPICSRYCTKAPPCAHQANPAQQVRRQYRGGPLVTDVLPIPPLVSPPGPSVVTSLRAPRQFPQCLGMFFAAVLGRPGRSFQNRPARANPHPLPHVALPFPPTGKSHPRRSIFLLRASFFPAHTPLPIASSLISPVSVSAQLQAQLSSGGAHTHTHTHTLARTLALVHQQHILMVGGTARQDRHGLFIVLTVVVAAWVCCVCTVHMHTNAHPHRHTHTTCTHAYRILYCSGIGSWSGG